MLLGKMFFGQVYLHFFARNIEINLTKCTLVNVNSTRIGKNDFEIISSRFCIQSDEISDSTITQVGSGVGVSCTSHKVGLDIFMKYFRY